MDYLFVAVIVVVFFFFVFGMFRVSNIAKELRRKIAENNAALVLKGREVAIIEETLSEHSVLLKVQGESIRFIESKVGRLK